MHKTKSDLNYLAQVTEPLDIILECRGKSGKIGIIKKILSLVMSGTHFSLRKRDNFFIFF